MSSAGQRVLILESPVKFYEKELKKAREEFEKDGREDDDLLKNGE